jgi:DNA-binding transcriptional LysR family regulator
MTLLTRSNDSRAVALTPVAGRADADTSRGLGQLPVEPPGRGDFMLLQALVECGTLSGAAKATGTTQSVASRRIARMERRYAVPLIAIEHEDVRLTEAGWALLAAGRRLLRTLEGVLQGLHCGQSSHAASALPTLRMAAFGKDWVDLADDLVAHVPGMLLDIVSAETELGLELFDRHRADAAYVWQPRGARHEFGRPTTVDLVVEEPLWVALPVDHRCADRTEVRLADLADDRWIVGSTSEAREVLSYACRGVVEPNIGFTVESSSQLRSLLGHGQGIALASPLTMPPKGRGGFVTRPLVEVPMRRLELVSDPTVVCGRLAAALLVCLRRCYVERAQQRNPAYVYSPHFPVSPVQPCQTTPMDGELFSGLAVTPSRSETARAGVVLEPEDLHLLRVVSECGSLNRAAPILLITQPALTRRIGRLEHRLGLGLLVRGHRGTVLTPTARRLLEGVCEAESGVRSVLSGFRHGRWPKLEFAAS